VAIGWSTGNEDVVTGGALVVASGVPSDIWSYTIGEGQVRGFKLSWTAGFYTVGATERARGYADFVVSRDVGGVAEVTANGAPIENGSIAGGTLAVAAVGNTVVASVTYTVTGTLYYTLRIEADPLIAVTQV
jgi:hypothetical protein